MSRWTRPERRRKAASSRSRQISVFGGSWCWAWLVRFLRDLSLLLLQPGPARPPAPPQAQEVGHGVPAWARRPLHSGASISGVLFPGSRPRGLPAAPPARAGGTPAETFTSKTMLRCLFRRCLAPVLAPVACRRPPRRLRPVILMVKHSTLATRDVTFPIVLRIPIYIDGKTRHFDDIGRRFLDSVANSKNSISGSIVNYRPGRHP